MELVPPMYNERSYLSLKNLGKTVSVRHGQIRQSFSQTSDGRRPAFWTNPEETWPLSALTSAGPSRVTSSAEAYSQLQFRVPPSMPATLTSPCAQEREVINGQKCIPGC